MKDYKLYLFDFDYTLVNSEGGIVKCFELAIDEMGYTSPGRDFIRRTIGLPMREAVGKIIASTDEAEITTFIDNYKKYANEFMTPGTHFFPHTVETLEAIRARGGKIGIISTKTHHRIAEKFEVSGTTHLIDRIIGCEDVTTFKPSPEGINKAAELFAIAKADILYTGDSFVDAGAAENAGVDFVAVTTGTTTAERFSEYPHIKIISDIGELLD